MTISVPVGNAAPPRPRRPDVFTSSNTSSEVIDNTAIFKRGISVMCATYCNDVMRIDIAEVLRSAVWFGWRSQGDHPN